jgi:hypothetical protein
LRFGTHFRAANAGLTRSADPAMIRRLSFGLALTDQQADAGCQVAGDRK